MPARNDMVHWTNELELADLRRWTEVDGLTKERAAIALNEKYHKGKPVRTANSVSMMRTRRKWYVAKIPTAHKEVGPRKEQEVEREEGPDGIVLKSRGSRIKTVADLLAHANVTGEVTKQTVKTWDTTLVENGESKTVQNFAIHVEVKPNQTSTADAVQAIIDGAFAKRTLLPKHKTPKVFQSHAMQALGIFDPHFAKLAWGRETGHGDYDLKIATTLVREGASHLIAKGNGERIEARLIMLGGDVFHFDTPHGTTTSGTPLERDGRVQKMLEEGSKCLFDVIEESADAVPTRVVVVPGNHDFVLSWALQEILKAYFRNSRAVTVDTGFTDRKYETWGKCLLGLTHGDNAPKILPGLMAREAAVAWSDCALRHWHRGHLHQRKQVQTIEGVTIFDHPSLSTADSWHAKKGFISERGMDAIIYHKAGAVVATHSYTPDVQL